ncbi:MAG: DUF3667 domain-containing protein [Parvularculaceae bacterium]
MAGDIPDIDPGDGGGVDDTIRPKTAGPAAAGGSCLSCGAALSGEFCSRCGQRNDDMRRSSLSLFRDFLEDTFSFDSRMWRTLGLMAAQPGLVPSNYSHGKRSRYTPPVRLFLVVSFLFFLTLGFTKTYFIALEVTEKTPDQIAEEKARVEEVIKAAGQETAAKLAAAKEAAGDNTVSIAGEDINCNINVKTRFFIRAKDLKVDEKKWRECVDSVSKAADKAIDESDEAESTPFNPEGAADKKDKAKRAADRIVGGVGQMVTNPSAFNNDVNEWLPRVMFFMAPVLALLLALFIRGKDALFFDHLVLSLYSHAAGFSVVGAAIVAGQFGFRAAFPIAVIATSFYYIAALRRAYHRGWVKTIYTAAFTGLLYILILTTTVGGIISNQIWRAG